MGADLLVIAGFLTLIAGLWLWVGAGPAVTCGGILLLLAGARWQQVEAQGAKR